MNHQGQGADAREAFIFPTSSSQKQLWFLQQINPGNSAYNVPVAYRVRGALQPHLIEESVNRLVVQHEILRSRFEAQEGVPYQVVDSRLAVQVERVDLIESDQNALESRLQEEMAEHASRLFNLATGPLLRIKIVKLGEQDWLLLLCFHHLIVDQVSLELFSSQLAECYRQLIQGEEPVLPEVELHYADYTVWQQEWIASEEFAESLQGLADELEGQSGRLALPASKQRPGVQSFVGTEIQFQFSEELSQSLKALARESGVSLFTLMVSAYQVLLGRFAGQGDAIVGVPFANRMEAETEQVVGYFINTLPFCSQLDGDPSFRALLHLSAQRLARYQGFQSVPLDELLHKTHFQRDGSHNPLIQHGFTLQAPPMRIELPGLAVEPLHTHNGGSKFDTFVFMWEEAGRIHGLYEYCSDLFDAWEVEQLIECYQAILSAATADVDTRVGSLNLLPRAKLEEIIVAGTGIDQDYQGFLVHHLVEDQARANPGACAVSEGDRSLTYQELDKEAAQLAARLQGVIGGRGLPVGIYLERSLESAIAVLGILKSGNACLPLDPSYPVERLGYMLKQSQARVLVSCESLYRALSDKVEQCLLMDDPGLQEARAAYEVPRTSSEDLIYVLFTSGSTGQPKGVAMPHRAMGNLVQWQLEQSGLGKGQRTLQFAPLSFDVSFQEMFSTWASGGCLMLVDDEIRRDPKTLLSFIAENEIARIYLPFVALQQLAEAAQGTGSITSSLLEVYVAGEQLLITPEIRNWFGKMPGCRLLNHYGPTETHVVTSFELTGDRVQWPNLPPIGKPLPNCQIRVLDEHLAPVPYGVTGELWIGGEQVAVGYMGRDDLTAERFVGDSFSDKSGSKIYRTGDLARLTRGGDIEFLGRADDQVKFRGYRIELGEIESVISTHPDIEQSAVRIRDLPHGQSQLLGYFLPKKGSQPEVNELRLYLDSKLPDYMVPQHLIQLEDLPLTASGKLDRKALPEPDGLSASQSSYIAPSSPMEISIASLWQELLGVEKVGVTDDFFELGGHSLLAVQLFARLAKKTGRNLPLATLFSARTVGKLAIAYGNGLAGLEEGPQGKGGEDEISWDYLVPIKTSGSSLPFYCIHGVGGNVLNYYQFIQYLDPDQPIYGLQCRGLDGLTSPFKDLETMASFYVEAIRKFQPRGPYVLGGGSMGGNIAFLMAGLLQEVGEEVSLVILFDAFGPSYVNFDSPDLHDAYQTKLLKGLLVRVKEQFTQLPFTSFLSAAWRGMLERLTVVRKLTQVLFYRLFGRPMPHELRYWYIERCNLRLLFNYQPRRFFGKAVLFRCPVEVGTVYEQPDLGWASWVEGELEIIEIPGTTHDNFIETPETGTQVAVALKRNWEKIRQGIPRS